MKRGGAEDFASIRRFQAFLSGKSWILRELPSSGKAHIYAYSRYVEILNTEEDASRFGEVREKEDGSLGGEVA